MIKVKRKLLLWLAAIFILIVVISVAKSFTNNSEDKGYKLEVINRGDVKQIVSANGTLNPVILVNVGTQISGLVRKIYADFNDHVKANQILLELDATLLVAELNISKAQFQKAIANLAYAKASAHRGEALRRKGYISKQDWDQLVQQLNSATADLNLAKAQVKRNEINLNYATIHSPVSGVIVDREVDVGQTVAASFQTPTLFKIAKDLSKMQIDSSFAEADIANILPGQEVEFTVDAFPNRNFRGKVKQIRLNPTTQQNVVTYDVVVTVENPEQILLPGMTAYVSIKTLERKNVLVVPNSALRYKPTTAQRKKTFDMSPGSGMIYKYENDKPKATICKLGITDNRNTEIISCAIKENDKVIVGETKGGTDKSSHGSFRMRMF